MKSLLIVEDDLMFCEAMMIEFSERGYLVQGRNSLRELKAENEFCPTHAIVDLKLKGESGLEALEFLKKSFPDCLIIVLTGYGSIVTAVQAVKLGATNYISKPASIDAIEAAFLGTVPSEDQTAAARHSLYRHEREYIEKVIHDFDGNISQAAKALGIHRQSLQRKLRKFTT